MNACASIPEASYIEYTRLLSMHPQARYRQEPTGQWLTGDIRHTFYNRVMQVRFNAEEADVEIEKMVARYVDRGLPMAWMVGPSSQPADLGRRLRAHGLSQSGVLRGMVADLTASAHERPCPESMLIQTVSDNEALQNWVMIVARSYMLPRHIAGSLFKNYSNQGSRPYLPFRLYLGSVESGPVAAALLLLGIHTAGIYNVGTLPEARRRGYGAAITRHAMLEARELGYPIAALASTEMGVGIYQRLGFVECCQLEIYEIKKPRKW